MRGGTYRDWLVLKKKKLGQIHIKKKKKKKEEEGSGRNNGGTRNTRKNNKKQGTGKLLTIPNRDSSGVKRRPQSCNLAGEAQSRLGEKKHSRKQTHFGNPSQKKGAATKGGYEQGAGGGVGKLHHIILGMTVGPQCQKWQ